MTRRAAGSADGDDRIANDSPPEGRPLSPQRWDAARYERDAGFVAELGRELVSLLAPRKGERVLDLGCGDGRLTRVLTDAGCEVVAVDASASQVAAACRRGLDARVADAERLDFSEEFDAVFSNAALHWMKRPDRVLAGVSRALRPGGRFVAELGGAGNVRAVRTALDRALSRRGLDASRLDPWYFPTADEHRGRLERAGFRVASIGSFPRPTPIPGDLVTWLETFAGPFTATLSEPERREVYREVRESSAPDLRRPDGSWLVDYVRLRFAAEKPVSG